MNSSHYGEFYWRVQTPTDLIWLHSHTAEIDNSGTLILRGPNGQVLWAFAKGQWETCYAAGLMDGGAVSVEHWDAKISGKKATKAERQAIRDSVDKSRRWKILTRDGFKCVKCGSSASSGTLEVDHIIPVSKGGSSLDANLQTLCFSCNRGKRDT